MARSIHAAAALLCVFALGSCGNDTDAPDSDDETTSAGTTPTRLYIGRVVRSAPAGSAGCLDDVDADWTPETSTKVAKLCGVQDGTETWFSVDPATTFEASVTAAEASVPETSTTGDWVVAISLDEASAQRFGAMATKLLAMPAPDPMALVIDGRVVSAPVPTPGIEGVSTLQIGGNFTHDEADEIAAALSSG